LDASLRRRLPCQGASVTKTCCNGDCHQGRECPLRQRKSALVVRVPPWPLLLLAFLLAAIFATWT
jgi:hypothetical protein